MKIKHVVNSVRYVRNIHKFAFAPLLDSTRTVNRFINCVSSLSLKTNNNEQNTLYDLRDVTHGSTQNSATTLPIVDLPSDIKPIS